MVEQPGPELVSAWDAGIVNGTSICYAIVLACMHLFFMLYLDFLSCPCSLLTPVEHFETFGKEEQRVLILLNVKLLRSG